MRKHSCYHKIVKTQDILKFGHDNQDYCCKFRYASSLTNFLFIITAT